MNDSDKNFQRSLKNRRVGFDLDFEHAAELMGISEKEYKDFEEGRATLPFPEQMALLIKLNPLDQLVIQLREGEITCTKGEISSTALSAIKDVFVENDIQEATIKKYQRGTHHFLPPIPSSIHQRLRNLLTNLS